MAGRARCADPALSAAGRLPTPQIFFLSACHDSLTGLSAAFGRTRRPALGNEVFTTVDEACTRSWVWALESALAARLYAGSAGLGEFMFGNAFEKWRRTAGKDAMYSTSRRDLQCTESATERPSGEQAG